jgi:RNA polymerase sigma-70 factor (ECF subfamily)
MEEHFLRGDSDHELLEKARSGEEDAFRRIVEEHTGIVYAAVRSILGNRADVEDAVQEVFIRVYRGLGSFEGRSSLSTWIWSVARNHTINIRAGERVEHVPLDGRPEIESSGRGPEAELAAKEAAADIEFLLSGLEGRYREVIELRYLAGMKYHRISALLGIPEGTVKTLIHRARKTMKKMMEEREWAERKADDAVNGL